ncbi:MAG: hypothetical protein NTW29_15105 [Bacteroidetes bacterium]|nr:hypothetical protein [Bacteroidota bacterium]
MTTIEIFQLRSKKKKRNAIFMLSVGIVVIIIGMGIFLGQLSELARTLDKTTKVLAESNNLNPGDKESLMRSIEITEILNMVSRIVFIIIIFFIAQIFLKLYKHNMNLSDFYFSCCDAWTLNEEVSANKKKEFYISLLKAIYPSEIKLDIPQSPDFTNLTNIFKKE